MTFNEWAKRYYPKENEATLRKMSHAWAAGHVNMAAPQPAKERSETMEKEVIIFTKKSCPNCVTIKKMMEKRGINYQEYNVEEPEGLTELICLEAGIQTVPVLVWNGEVITDVEKMEEKIKVKRGEKNGKGKM